MASTSNRPGYRIALRAPVITLVLAATAIPVELRHLVHPTLDFGVYAYDVMENVAGYVPVGIVLGELGPLRGVLAAVLIATFAETTQFAMMHRVPSVIDLASNLIGAILGTVIRAYWRIRSPGLDINRGSALVAATLALVLLLGMRATAGDALNTRGATAPGILEAYWKLDESHGRVAVDSSGHGLNGRFSNEPQRVAGTLDGAVRFNGSTDYVDFRHSTALRLVGSMTISAWIKARSFPVDDAAIVSQLNKGLGYQLDTTVDRKARTIGFKLTNACGNLMARYGATPLVVDTWYHVAGVYNAEGQTLDVYLNGKLDDGFLLGSVTGTQRSSRADLYVGRRSDFGGFGFAGSIRDVRIYSLALTQPEIAAVMHGTPIEEPEVPRTRGDSRHPGDLNPPCAVLSEPEDARTPGAAAAFGVLIAIACIGFFPSAGPRLCLIVSFAAGLLFLPATASALRAFNLWMMPLVCLAGGASVAFSVRPRNNLDD
jgi:VanZ family protein